MKRIFLTTMFAILILQTGFAQTNVSGGIYSNTTWTLANSPYIVVDTVVVFPAVTLTIQPGVIVKFADNKRLEIRQATLIAQGTTTDSIIFTSNSASGFPGIWGGIYMNGNLPSIFDYCRFYFANNAIELSHLGYTDTTFVKNSNFKNNITGFYSGWSAPYFIYNSEYRNNTNGIISYTSDGAFIKSCTVKFSNIGIVALQLCRVENCVIDSNNKALILSDMGNNIHSCEINHNNIGIIDTTYSSNNNLISTCTIQYNNIGIKIGTAYESIHCNKICNNTIYDFYFKVSFGANITIDNNYWCTTDSTTIASHIYDGYDNINLGLAHFMPLDTSQCFLTGCNLSLSTTATNSSCGTCYDGSATANPINGTAPYTYTWYTSPLQTTQTAVNLLPGTYSVCVIDANGCTACNSVTVDSVYCNGFTVTANSINGTCNLCNDGTAWVNVTGGTLPYSYTWYTSPIQTTDTAVNVLPGQYAVCVSDAGGCLICDSVIIGTGSCSAHFDLYPNVAPHTYDAVNMASGVSLTYLWSWGDGTTDVIPYPSHTYAAAGFYNICLTITDSVGCTSTFCNPYYLLRLEDAQNTMVYINVVSSGVKEVSAKSPILIFPNPASDNLTISLPVQEKTEIRIFDLLGVVKSEMIITAQQSTIDISNLPKGIYFIEISSSSNTSRIKFIKK